MSTGIWLILNSARRFNPGRLPFSTPMNSLPYASSASRLPAAMQTDDGLALTMAEYHIAVNAGESSVRVRVITPLHHAKADGDIAYARRGASVWQPGTVAVANPPDSSSPRLRGGLGRLSFVAGNTFSGAR